MLTKRTNILFEEETWQTLLALAKSREVSVGELVRKAVKTTYLQEAEKTKRMAAAKEIISLRKKQKEINYKELINYGRKY